MQPIVLYRNTFTVGTGYFQPGNFCGSYCDLCRIPAFHRGLARRKEKNRRKIKAL